MINDTDTDEETETTDESLEVTMKDLKKEYEEK
jgi:hypothetical protein